MQILIEPRRDGGKTMAGTFYIVGVGPGDPMLLTLKAAEILRNCKIWFVPSAFEKGGSMALQIASGAVDSKGKTILSHHFPMKQVRRAGEPDPEVKAAWKEAADTIIACLARDEDVVFPTLGDPAIYSTGFYVWETLRNFSGSTKVEVVPGVSAIGASSAVSKTPVCLGDEKTVVIPATFEDERLRESIEAFENVVFMKVHKVMPRLVALLTEMGLVQNAVLVERCSLPDEKIWYDIREAAGEKIHYFSTMILRK